MDFLACWHVICGRNFSFQQEQCTILTGHVVQCSVPENQRGDRRSLSERIKNGHWHEWVMCLFREEGSVWDQLFLIGKNANNCREIQNALIYCVSLVAEQIS